MDRAVISIAFHQDTDLFVRQAESSASDYLLLRAPPIFPGPIESERMNVPIARGLRGLIYVLVLKRDIANEL